MTKTVLAARTVVGSSLAAFQLSRNACHNAANQKWSELSRLVQLLRSMKLSRILEIGVSGGGTLALWAQLADFSACLIGIDLEIPSQAEQRVRQKLSNEQALHLLRADSHNASTRQNVLELLGGAELDFLFIDGDHSLTGVEQDWEMYAPLVREAGLVAFHDIVPDYSTRFGMQTDCNAGSVYEFWAGVKTGRDCHEFIEDPNQDGYGIGVIRM